MADWEKKIDINNVFLLQPTRPKTFFGVGAIAKLDEIPGRICSSGEKEGAGGHGYYRLQGQRSLGYR